jgi:hypothetical protein
MAITKSRRAFQLDLPFGVLPLREQFTSRSRSAASGAAIAAKMYLLFHFCNA